MDWLYTALQGVCNVLEVGRNDAIARLVALIRCEMQRALRTATLTWPNESNTFNPSQHIYPRGVGLVVPFEAVTSTATAYRFWARFTSDVFDVYTDNHVRDLTFTIALDQVRDAVLAHPDGVIAVRTVMTCVGMCDISCRIDRVAPFLPPLAAVPQPSSESPDEDDSWTMFGLPPPPPPMAPLSDGKPAPLDLRAKKRRYHRRQRAALSSPQRDRHPLPLSTLAVDSQIFTRRHPNLPECRQVCVKIKHRIYCIREVETAQVTESFPAVSFENGVCIRARLEDIAPPAYTACDAAAVAIIRCVTATVSADGTKELPPAIEALRSMTTLHLITEQQTATAYRFDWPE